MSYTPSEMITGLNPNTDFLLKLDTAERMKNVFQDYKEPIQYKIPVANVTDPYKGLTLPELFAEGDKGKALKDAYNSTSPELRDSAIQAILKKSNTSALESGVGQSRITEYDPWQNKYINDEYGLNPNLNQQENEAYYYDNQYQTKSGLGKLASNTGKFVGRVLPSAVLKFGEGFGYVGAMAVAGAQNLTDLISGKDNYNFMTTVAENALSRKLEEWENDLKESSLLSVYKPAEWEKKGFFEKMGEGAFWTDEFADGVAFLASAIIPGGIIGKMGKGVSLIGRGGKAWTRSMKFLGLETLGDLGSVAYNTTMESAMEAAEGFKTYKKELIKKREEGVPGYADLTDQDIDTKAGDVAANRFKANIGILSVSSLFENKFFFKPIANRLAGAASGAPTRIGARATINEAGEAIEATNAKTWIGKALGSKNGVWNSDARIPFYGKRFLSAAGMEGLWEENAQLAVERWSAQSPYLNSDDEIRNPGSGILGLANQYLTQTRDVLKGKDNDAETSIGLGALIGIFGGGVIAKAFGGSNADGSMKFGRGERRTAIANAKESILRYNKAYQNMLSLNDIHSKDEKGELLLDDKALEEKVKALNDFGGRQVTIASLKDPVLKEKLQKDLFAEYIAAAVRADVHEGLLARLENMPAVKQETWENLGFDPNSVFNDVTKYVSRGKELVKEYQDIHAINTVKPKQTVDKETGKLRPMTFVEHSNDENARKYFAFMAYARMRSSEDAKEVFDKEVMAQQDRIKTDSSPLNADYPIHLSDLVEYNKLVLEQESLELSTQEFEFFGQEDMIKANKARIKDIEAAKKAIKERLDSNKNISLTEKKSPWSESILLYDQDIRPEHHAEANALMNTARKSAQLHTDIHINKILHDRLKNEKDGAKAFKDYLDYLARNQVARNDAENSKTAEELKKELEEAEAKKQALKDLEDIDDDSLSDEQLALDQAQQDLLIAQKQAEIKALEEAQAEKEKQEDEKALDIMESITVREKKALSEIAPDPVNNEKYTTTILDAEGNETIITEDTAEEVEEKVKAHYKKETDDFLLFIAGGGVPGEQPKANTVISSSASVTTGSTSTTTSTEETTTATAGIDRFFQSGDNTKNVHNDGENEGWMKYETPFVTVGKAAENLTDLDGSEPHPYIEVLNPNSYLTALDETITKPIDFNVYEAVIVPDRIEWQSRFPPIQADANIAEGNLGMVLVFRKKGTKNEFLKIGDQLKGRQFKAQKDKIIMHAIDDPDSENAGFNVDIEKRAIVWAGKHSSTIAEAKKHFKRQQEIVRQTRMQVIIDGKGLLVNVTPFGRGIIPETGYSDYIVNRFKEYNPVFVLITKDNIDEYNDVELGRIYATFPGKVDRNSVQQFQVQVGSIFSLTTISDSSIEEKQLGSLINGKVTSIITGKTKFGTKAEAIEVIRNFLEKVVYTRKDFSEFEIVPEGDKFVIKHIKINDAGEKTINKSTASIPFNINNDIYNGIRNLSIPNDDGTLQEVPHRLYKTFVENRFSTRRKIIKTVTNKLHLNPMNAYYNIEMLEQPETTIEEAEEGVITRDEGLSSEPDPEPTSIEEAREILRRAEEADKTFKAPEQTGIFNIGNLYIDLTTEVFKYLGPKTTEAKQGELSNFIQSILGMQVTNNKILFGEYEITETKKRKKQTSKVYFVGNKEIGTFVMFGEDLTEINSDERGKFATENPAIYKEIQNKCN